MLWVEAGIGMGNKMKESLVELDTWKIEGSSLLFLCTRDVCEMACMTQLRLNLMNCLVTRETLPETDLNLL